MEPVVTAEARIGGQIFKDVNQTARATADANQPTLIAERVSARMAETGKPLPNGNLATAHAEVGAMQQAFDAGATRGADMSMSVTGQPVCGYYQGDIAALAQRSGLNSLTILEKATGRTLYWWSGMIILKVIP